MSNTQLQKYQIPDAQLAKVPTEILMSPELSMLYPMAIVAMQSGMTKIKSVPQAMFVMLRGQALGLSPIESLESIHVIEGKPTLSAQLMLALMKRNGYRVVDESTDTMAIATVWERGITGTKDESWVKLGTVTFGVEDAKAAGLMSKDVWKKYFKDMAWARVASRAARRYAPQTLCGMLYTPEELGADVDGEGNVIDVTPLPQNVVKIPSPAPVVEAVIEEEAPTSPVPVPPPAPVENVIEAEVVPPKNASPSPWDDTPEKPILPITSGLVTNIETVTKDAGDTYGITVAGKVHWTDSEVVFKHALSILDKPKPVALDYTMKGKSRVIAHWDLSD